MRLKVVVNKGGNHVVLALKRTFRRPGESQTPDDVNVSRHVVMERLRYLLKKLKIRVRFKFFPDYDVEDWRVYYGIDVSKKFIRDYYIFTSRSVPYYHYTNRVMDPMLDIYLRFGRSWRPEKLWGNNLILFLSYFDDIPDDWLESIRRKEETEPW